MNGSAALSQDQLDLALLPRVKLLKGGFEALSKQSPQGALEMFGAAIRKAQRVNLSDIEAEYFKFVALYLEGDFPEAVRRCVECLDGVKLFRDAVAAEGKESGFPFATVISTLESCLVQTMILRRDSLFTLIGHFWQVHYGEYYLLKKPNPLIFAVFNAFNATGLKTSIGFGLLKEELKPFSAYLQTRLDATLEDEEIAQAQRKAEIRQFADEAKKEMEAKKASGESANEQFLAMAANKGFMSLTDPEIEQLKEICATSRSQKSMVAIRRLIDTLGTNSKKPYLQALARNPMFATVDSKILRDRELSLLYNDIMTVRDELTPATA